MDSNPTANPTTSRQQTRQPEIGEENGVDPTPKILKPDSKPDTIEEIKEVKNIKKKEASTIDFLESLKNNQAYQHINIPIELAKMDAWLSTRPGRKKTKRFILNWLNRIEAPVGLTPIREIDKYGRN